MNSRFTVHHDRQGADSGSVMRKFIFALFVVIGLSGSPANATVTTNTVFCRAQPTTTSSIITRIPAGSSVTVRRREPSWALVTRQPQDCWINSRYLSEDSAAKANRYSLEQVRSGSHRATHSAYRFRQPSRRAHAWAAPTYRSPKKHTRTRRAPSYNYGGSCPCSGRNICIGPRGGRYCITSGGNKRYGV